MPLIAYPASLPGPEAGSLSPRPRRAASSDGPLEQRARQRDFAGALSQYPFMYTPADMAAWREWFRTMLLDGRRWFTIALPGDGGVVTRVVKYREVREHKLGAGNYRVDATFEQRGSAVAPRSISYLFLDTFRGDSGDDIEGHSPDIAPEGFAYATVSGFEPVELAGNRIRSSDENSTGRVEGAGLGMNLIEYPYTLRMVGTIPPATGSGSLEEVFARAEAADGAFVHVGLGTHMASEEYRALLQYNDGSSPTETFSALLAGHGSHEVAARVTAGVIGFYVNGSLAHTVTGFPSFLVLDTLTLQTDVDGGGIYTFMDRVAIEGA